MNKKPKRIQQKKKRPELIVTTRFIPDDKQVMRALLILRGYSATEIEDIMYPRDIIVVKSDKAA